MFKPDGRTRPVTMEDIVLGNILRMVQRTNESAVAPFADCVIVEILESSIRLARPYVEIAKDEPTGYRASLNSFEVPISRVIEENSLFLLVLTSREVPHNIDYSKRHYHPVQRPLL